MRQIMYEVNNIQKTYLCVYTKVWIADGKLYMINTLNNKKIIVEKEEKELHYILNLLYEGVEDEELLQTLSNMNCKQLYDIWMKMGMIE